MRQVDRLCTRMGYSANANFPPKEGKEARFCTKVRLCNKARFSVTPTPQCHQRPSVHAPFPRYADRARRDMPAAVGAGACGRRRRRNTPHPYPIFTRFSSLSVILCEEQSGEVRTGRTSLCSRFGLLRASLHTQYQRQR
jgi:hypothetical protein